MQENVNAFDKAKAQQQRKAYIGSLIMTFVLVICIILAIFAWFKLRQTATASLSSGSVYAAGNLNIQYNTYAGTMLSNGTVEYDEGEGKDWNAAYGENEPEVLTYPGERRYFKTVITNNESRAITGTLYFKNMLVNSKFITTKLGAESVNFQSQIEGDEGNLQAFDLINNSTVVQGEDYSIIPLQPICENITLPATVTSGGNDDTVTVYWYVTLNGANVENDIGSLFLQFNEITFIEN